MSAIGGKDHIQIANLVHGEHILFEEQIPRGPQRYLRRNWYFFDVLTPFTRGDVNRVTLRTDGEDFWLPWYFFLFGLDTAAGNPTQAYPLVDIPPHSLGVLASRNPATARVKMLAQMRRGGPEEISTLWIEWRYLCDDWRLSAQCRR
jgi:hypothetical protein